MSRAAFLATALALCQMLLVGLSPYVLCLGSDGRVSLEHSQDGLSCAPRTAEPLAIASGLDCAAAEEESDPCGPCVDIPLSAGDEVVQKMGRQTVALSSHCPHDVIAPADSSACPLFAGNARAGLSAWGEWSAGPPLIFYVVLLL